MLIQNTVVHLQSLSILNYFRSVERTLTINDGGLSLESGRAKRARYVHRVDAFLQDFQDFDLDSLYLIPIIKRSILRSVE